MKIPSLEKEHIIHSIKTAIACLIGFGITKSLVHLAFDQWLIITILVVMCAQINVGSIIQKSYMRFLGTLVGSALSALVLILFGTNPIAMAGTIMFAAMVFSYIATSRKDFSDAGTLGAATVTIILLGQDPTVSLAGERFLEISIGILIAALVSQFILPIHARTHLRRNQAETISQLRDYYELSFFPRPDENGENFQTIEESIIGTLATQRKLAIEAAREPLGKKFNASYFTQSLWCEKEILRSIIFMRHACHSSAELKKILMNMPRLDMFHQSINETLKKIVDYLENKDTTITLIEIPKMQPIRLEIENAVKDMGNLVIEDANAFLFCAKTLKSRVLRLMELIAGIKK